MTPNFIFNLFGLVELDFSTDIEVHLRSEHSTFFTATGCYVQPHRGFQNKSMSRTSNQALKYMKTTRVLLRLQPHSFMSRGSQEQGRKLSSAPLCLLSYHNTVLPKWKFVLKPTWNSCCGTCCRTPWWSDLPKHSPASRRSARRHLPTPAATQCPVKHWHTRKNQQPGSCFQRCDGTLASRIFSHCGVR